MISAGGSSTCTACCCVCTSFSVEDSLSWARQLALFTLCYGRQWRCLVPPVLCSTFRRGGRRVTLERRRGALRTRGNCRRLGRLSDSRLWRLSVSRLWRL